MIENDELTLLGIPEIESVIVKLDVLYSAARKFRRTFHRNRRLENQMKQLALFLISTGTGIKFVEKSKM